MKLKNDLFTNYLLCRMPFDICNGKYRYSGPSGSRYTVYIFRTSTYKLFSALVDISGFNMRLLRSSKSKRCKLYLDRKIYIKLYQKFYMYQCLNKIEEDS